MSETNPEAIKKLDEILEKDSKSLRQLTGFWKALSLALGAGMVLFYFFTAGLKPLGPQYHRGVYVLITYLLIFLYYPMRGLSRDSTGPSILDVTFMAGSLASCVYWIHEFGALNERAGAENDMDYLMGVIGLVCSIEAARRILGWSMSIIAL